MSEYLDIFVAEVSENITLLNSTLIEVEKKGSSSGLMKEVIRAVHTIKGMAATMGYKNLTSLTHELENHLMSLNTLSKPLIQTLFKTVDRLQQFHDVVAKKGKVESVQVDDIIRELKSGGAASAARSGSGTDDVLKQGVSYKVAIKFKSQTRLIGARGFQALRIIDSLSEINSSDPPVDVLEDGKLVGDIDMEIITYESEIELRQALAAIEDVESITITRLMEEEGPRSVLGGPSSVVVRRPIQSVRVNLDRLDSVIDLLGELVITRGRFQSLLPRITAEISEQFQIFDSTITNIQESVMGMRMVGLGQIFESYPRAVRDIAHSRGMEIDLVVQGTHIQMDRSVIDQVNEALLHLIRNAAIHGIEDEKDRKKAGKQKTGRILLVARRERGEISISVEDDGRGLDLEAIKNKAVQLGLVDPEDELSRTDVAKLIFRPGFSTAEKVTDIAGRGVGMDIVKSTIDEIGGSISIRTKKGEGTRFTIRVQQTLAIIEALIVKVGGTKFAIPLLNVEKVFSMEDPVIDTFNNIPYVNWEGHNIRIVDLEERMSRIALPIEIKQQSDTHRMIKAREKIILWERAGNRTALKVTNVLEQREIVNKQLDIVYSQMRGFLGATVLGFDEVALIIDPDTIEQII